MDGISCIRHNIPVAYLLKVPLYAIIPSKLKRLRTLLVHFFLANAIEMEHSTYMLIHAIKKTMYTR